MRNVRTAAILSILYWLVAAVFAIFAPRGDWIDLRWPIAIYLFAVPTTFLLWLFVVATRYFRSPTSRLRFTLIGIALPFAYVALALGGGHWLGELRQRRLTEQWAVATLDTVADEPLVTAQGPIGVRLRYRVTYPKGLDLDEGHGAFAQVGLEHMSGVFFAMRRTVTPHVSGAWSAGTYEITEDFLPSFFPLSLVDSKLDPATYGRCFSWNPNMSRQYVLAADTQTFVIDITISHSSSRTSTGHSYRLADFYDTAIKEGGVNCNQNGN
jgi:hypothetical protein